MLKETVYNKKKGYFEILNKPNKSGTGPAKLTLRQFKLIIKEKIDKNGLHFNIKSTNEYKFVV
tara:strand:+ start:460 stop:648 length:189 start_codon:yes stop_codon:yes gene_type:complete